MTSRSETTRTGQYVQQPGGFKAFYPAVLPFSPEIRYNDELIYILSMADRAVGRLDSSADMIPNPDFFVSMYVRKEAVLTSQIEGVTQASLGDFLEQEATLEPKAITAEYAEVRNYVLATNHALNRLGSLPLGLQLIKDTHKLLLEGVRGSEFTPGEFRTEQNWIGIRGSDPFTADFVPPPPDIMEEALDDFERYLQEESLVPDLVKVGLLHYQFETIHPFRDGNGRIGRLIMTVYLCEKGILKRPLLYLSEFINENKREYYETLQAARDRGDIEGWLRYILTAIWRVAESAGWTAQRVLALREEHRNLVSRVQPRSGNGLRLLDYLFQRPYVTVRTTANALGVSFPTANNLLRLFVEQGILEGLPIAGANRVFRYQRYINLMEKGLDSGEDNPLEHKISSESTEY